MASNQPHHASSFPAKGNPYAALSLPNFATPSLIKKQFRQLSLKYHPDKRSSDLTPSQHAEYDRLFMDVQEARDFLLDHEFQKQKQEYDDKLRSELLRKEEEERREQAMSSKRRRMKQDLEEKIRALSGQKRSGVNDKNKNVDETFEHLKRDGMKRRQEFGTSQSAMEEKIRMKEFQKQKDYLLQNRQVRIKWSRKKLGGQSEDMLAKLLQRFGPVESVELIGDRGNSALVTFQNESSCDSCVDFYKTSDELRAHFVGKKRRQREEEKEEENDDERHAYVSMLHHRSSDRDRESVMERKLRQAAEREALLRKMEMGEEWGDDDDNVDIDNDDNDHGKERSASANKKHRVSSSSTTTIGQQFPPPFPPCTSSCRGPIEKLQELERTLLKDLLSVEQIAEMQV
jgi:DnaJ-class molecular chaperone with C-terminal Zn finger domain